MANPVDAPIGAGMAKKAASTIALKKEYDRHVIDAASNGEDPMKYEDWVAKRMEDQKAGYDSAK
jgi:hypothetical protein